MITNPWGSASASWREQCERISAEVIRRVKLAAKNDAAFVAVADDTSAMLAARVHAVQPTIPPPAPDDSSAILAARSYLRALISASGRRLLTFGVHLTGGVYDGSSDVTLATDATSLNTASTIVARDAGGNFVATTITAALTGNATTSSSTTGNAGTATALQTARTINGVSFDGSANITVTAAAGTLTGATLNATVTASSLTTVGTLLGLVLGPGVAPSLTNGGTNPTCGTATLGVGGTVTVSTTAVGATDLLFFQRVATGGTIGFATTYTINAGVSFTITSDNVLDRSVYNWILTRVH